MSTTNADEVPPIKNIISNYVDEQTKLEKERFDMLLGNVKSWNYTEKGIAKYNVPPMHFWFDLYKCPGFVKKEFYEEIAAKNGLKLVYESVQFVNGNAYYYTKNYTFACSLD